jgi:hypothetical protein
LQIVYFVQNGSPRPDHHDVISFKLIMDLLRFAEIEPHDIIPIKLIMDLLRFAKNIFLKASLMGSIYTVYN